MDWLERLKEMKKKSGKTNEEISKLSNVPQSTIGKIFAGQTKAPTLSNIRDIVHSMGYTLDDLERISVHQATDKLLDAESLMVAHAYSKASDKDKRMVRMQLDLEPFNKTEISKEFNIHDDIKNTLKEIQQIQTKVVTK